MCGRRAARAVASLREADPDFLDAEAEVLGSTPVLAIAASDPSLAGVPQLKRAADPVAWLRRSLGVEVDGRESRITVSFDAAEPQEADQVLSAVIAAYRRYDAAQGHTPGTGLFELFASEKEQRQAELARKTQQLQDHARQYGTPTTRSAEGDRSTPIGRRLAEVSEALAAAQCAAVDATAARQEVAETILTNPKHAAELAEVRAAGVGQDVSRIRARQQQARAQLMDLRNRYLPGAPALEAAQRELDHLDVAYAAAADERCEQAKRAEADAERAFDDLQKEAREQRAHAAEYAWLEAEVNVARRHLEALENRIDEAARAAAPQIDVLTSPRAASEPTKPQPGAPRGWRWWSACSRARRWRARGTPIRPSSGPRGMPRRRSACRCWPGSRPCRGSRSRRRPRQPIGRITISRRSRPRTSPCAARAVRSDRPRSI